MKSNADHSFLLRVAADARLCTTHYADDHIWDIRTGGDPAALAIQTSFGLRAQALRIFPSFRDMSGSHSDPTSFLSEVAVAYAYPNACALHFSPIQSIDVLTEYWVPESWLLAGRVHLENKGTSSRQFQFELVGQLTPLAQGRPMAPVPSQVSTMLSGQAGDLFPTLFLTGGPGAGAGPFPSLSLPVVLEPGASRQLSWALAALPSAEEAFDEARRATARAWEAEQARIELVNTRDRVMVTTGQPDCDSLFQRAQDAAFQLLLSPTEKLPHLSFVATRQPDQGYSAQGEGLDYGPDWGGQTAFQALSLAGMMLPGSPEIVQGFVRNQLSTRDRQGRVDWKAGLAGQRGSLLVQPVLANLAWKASCFGEDIPFLREVYPLLQDTLSAWLSPMHDRDGDGFPEYDHAFQSGLEELPLFDRWHPGSQGVDIRTVESPALASFLCKEMQSLSEIARHLQMEDQAGIFAEQAKDLGKRVLATWDEGAGIFRYRDRDTHTSPAGVLLYEGLFDDDILLQSRLDVPQRLVMRLSKVPNGAPLAGVRIKGSLGRKTVEEEIEPSAWQPYGEAFWATTKQVFRVVKRVFVPAALQGAEGRISTPDLQQEDLSLFLPLWAGIPCAEQAQRQWSHLQEAYALPEGLGMLPGAPTQISLPWNHLVIEGLLNYGFRKEAAELYSRILTTASASLENGTPFPRLYSSATHSSQREIGHVDGLPSIDLFINLLGLKILGTGKVIACEINPFPWTVELKYRGMKLLRRKEEMEIIFPDGQAAHVSGPGAHLVARPRSRLLTDP